MALVPIRLDRTSKPPIGTPLRSDGHWSVQGLVGAWAFNEGAGTSLFNSGSWGQLSSTPVGTPSWNALGLKCESGSITQSVKQTVVNNQSKITLGVWLKASSRGSDMGSLHLGDGIASSIKITTEYLDPVVLFIRDENYNAGHVGDTSVNITDGSIKFVCYTVDFSNVTTGGKLYLDGKLVYSGAVPSINNLIVNTVKLGESWQGTLCNAFVSTGLLPPDKVQALADNPWQIYEPETVWVEVGGGGEAALFAGSIYGQSSVSAQLSTAITIASQVVSAGSILGGISTAIRLATSSQGSASASALLTTAIRMAASAQGYGASTADLSTAIAMAADILAASSASGALSTAIRFGGALSGSSTTTAALTNAITMAAQAVGLGSISGQLAGTVAAALFAGTISGSSSASANLSTAVILAAAAQGSATAQAALSTALELAAQVNGIGSAAGTLGADISGLAGSLHGSSEAQATLATAIHLMGVAAGQCVVLGRLAEPVEILAQLRVMASDPLALRISVRDPLALRVTVH